MLNHFILHSIIKITNLNLKIKNPQNQYIIKMIKYNKINKYKL